MIEYYAEGKVIGNLWDGGKGTYLSRSLFAKTKEELDKLIRDGIKSGSLDSGMGFQSLSGAAMTIIKKETRIIDNKPFVNKEYTLEFYGELSAEEIEWLNGNNI